MMSEPRIEERPEQPYVGIRSLVTMAEMPTLPPLWDEVFGWLASKGIQPAGAPLWRYRVVDMETALEIDVAVPVEAPVQGEGRIISDVLPGGRYVTTVYTGPYEGDGMMNATADLLAWAAAQGLTWDMKPVSATGEGWAARVEHYLTDPVEEPDPTQYETELAFKLA